MNRDAALEIVEHGTDRGLGNLLGIQPFMERADYALQETFYQKLDSYFKRAADAGWIGERTLVALPEHIGTWLVVEGEGQAVVSAKRLSEAMRWLALRHLGPFLWELIRAREQDRAAASLFRLKSGDMACVYQAVFSRLARTYAVTVSAGSILLASPQVVDGQIQAGCGPLFNSAFVFLPDGSVDRKISRKIYPVESELPFVACASLDDIPVYDTPAGRLGVIVCADSWFPQVYERLRILDVDWIVVPSAVSPASIWDQPWKGYSGWPMPEHVDPGDIGWLTECQAWAKYAMSGRVSASGARAGINIFLYADLWDMPFGGGQWKVVQGESLLEAEHKGPAVVNLWL